MILFDSHVHTRFSTDSKMKIEAAIKRAAELNIGIITTEHMDLNCPIPNKFRFDPAQYYKEYGKYRSDKVLLGIELGMINDGVLNNKELIESCPFDYVIGSIHIVDDKDIFYEDFYINKSKKEAYEHYLRYMLQCIKTHNFIDSLGHIDYIARYARYEDKEIYYEDFTEYIDEILKTIAENGKSLELNTRRLNNSEAVKNLEKIYKRFYALGGRTLTIGSDAHNVDSIGSSFDIAKAITESSNLRIVYYKARKPEYISG
jgi:histidinol-phosphatase (PHP family)